MYKYRIVYYAYSPDEVVYLKDKYNIKSIFIDMSHKLQSQMLLTNKQYDKIDHVVSDVRINEVLQMKTLSDFIISNDLEKDNILINKIMSQLNL